MAIKSYITDIDGNKVSKLINWRLNPLSTANRIALGVTLNTNSEGLPCFDTDLNVLYFWDGFIWTNSLPPSATDSVKISVTLGEAIGGGFVVYLSALGLAFKYDASDLMQYGKAIGITEQAGNIGDVVEVILDGKATQLGGLTMGDQYYASVGGLVTNVAPVINVFQPVGVAVSATALLVNIEKPYIKI